MRRKSLRTLVTVRITSSGGVFHAPLSRNHLFSPFRGSHCVGRMITDRNLVFIARRAQVKRAQDEAKTEIDAYRRTLEEDFKKKQDEVSIPSTILILPLFVHEAVTRGPQTVVS